MRNIYMCYMFYITTKIFFCIGNAVQIQQNKDELISCILEYLWKCKEHKIYDVCGKRMHLGKSH